MSQQRTIWLDGSQVSALPLPDRGLDFGDGVFETMLVHHGQPLFAQYHLERLATGMRILAIPDCLESIRVQLQSATDAISQNWKWAVLRISLLRGPGPRGYTPNPDSNPRILISVSQLNSDPARMFSSAVLGLADIRLATQPFFAQIKHLNRLEQVVAATQAHAQGVDESILLDQTGLVTSVISGNIFLLDRGELLTPILDTCGIAGTRRRLIIEKWAPAIGLKVRETRISLSDLEDAEEVFYSNSLITLRPVARLNLVHWESHPVCALLFQQFLKDLS